MAKPQCQRLGAGGVGGGLLSHTDAHPAGLGAGSMARAQAAEDSHTEAKPLHRQRDDKLAPLTWQVFKPPNTFTLATCNLVQRKGTKTWKAGCPGTESSAHHLPLPSLRVLISKRGTITLSHRGGERSAVTRAESRGWLQSSFLTTLTRQREGRQTGTRTWHAASKVSICLRRHSVLYRRLTQRHWVGK